VLGGIWLLDAVLQYQSFMFTRAFARMLAASADGNPVIVAAPITWSARIIGQHAVAANSVFATVQLLLALGIALRPTVKIALGASVAWSLAIWWLGEGLGSVLAGNASPVSGAPGAVIIYALLAILLWPAGTDRPATFAAGRFVGRPAARALWLVLWGSLAWFSIQPEVRSPRGLSSMISGAAAGEPGWLAAIDLRVGTLLDHHGLAASIAHCHAGGRRGGRLPSAARRPGCGSARRRRGDGHLVSRGARRHPHRLRHRSGLRPAARAAGRGLLARRRPASSAGREGSAVSGPAPLGYLLAAVMIVTAGYCMTRLAGARLRRRPTVPDLDISHVVMGVAMAGLLVPRLSVLPDGAWEAVFSLALGWFGWRFIRLPSSGFAGAASMVTPCPVCTTRRTCWRAGRCCSCSSPSRPPWPHRQDRLLRESRWRKRWRDPRWRESAVAGTVMGGQSAGTIRFPVLALALALALFGYVVWITDRMSSLPPVSALRLAAERCCGRSGRSPAPGGPRQCAANASLAGDARWPGMLRWPGSSVGRGCPAIGGCPAGPGCSAGPACSAVTPAGRVLRDRDEYHHGLHAHHDAVTSQYLTSG
jgi:hypothetical protein